MKWIKSKFQGVRYREHATRRHGVAPDRYYTIFYKLDGKMVQEALGWASESWEEIDGNGKTRRVNWTEKRAAAVLAELQKNQRLGAGPRTLKERRAIQEQALAKQRADSITVSEFWEQDYIHFLKGRIGASSWKKELTHYQKRIFPHLGSKALKTVTSDDIDRLVNEMRAENLTPRTIQYAVGTFFRIWKHAAKRGHVKPGDNPVGAIQVEQVNNTRLRVLTPQELKDILDYLAVSDAAAHAITLFCAFTGCRFSEAARLTCEHVDFTNKNALFCETKNGESRTIPLASHLITFLEKLGPGKAGEHIFTKRNGSPYSEPPNAFRTAANNLGLNHNRNRRDMVTFHTLRHTAATIAARHGTPVKDMQLIFGWKTPAMVFRYVKGDRETQCYAMRGLAQTLLGENAKVVPLRQEQKAKIGSSA